MNKASYHFSHHKYIYSTLIQLSLPHSQLFPSLLPNKLRYVSEAFFVLLATKLMSHYLEPAVHSKRVNFFEEDLFKVQQLAAPAAEPAASCYHHRDHNKMKKKRSGEKQQRKKQGRVCYVSSRKPKAVDEDLYKIPPELLYQIPKRKRLLGNFLYGCLGLNCIT